MKLFYGSVLIVLLYLLMLNFPAGIFTHKLGEEDSLKMYVGYHAMAFLEKDIKKYTLLNLDGVRRAWKLQICQDSSTDLIIGTPKPGTKFFEENIKTVVYFPNMWDIGEVMDFERNKRLDEFGFREYREDNSWWWSSEKIKADLIVKVDTTLVLK